VVLTVLQLGLTAHGAALTGSVEGATAEVGLVVEAIDPTLRLLGEAPTDEAGRFTLEDLPPALVRLRVRPEADADLPDRYYPDGDTWCEGAILDIGRGEVLNGLRIAVEEGGVLTGRVLDPAGQPVPDAALTAMPAEAGLLDWERSGWTESDGRFRITGVPSLAAGVRLFFDHGDHPQRYLGGYDKVDADPLVLRNGEELDLGDLAFGEGVSVSGVVLDEWGDPLVDIPVRAQVGKVTAKVSSGPDGEFHVDGLRAGRVQVWVAEDGWGVHYWPDSDRPAEEILLEEDGGSADVVLTLVPEATLTGQVVGVDADVDSVSLRAVNDDGSVSIGVEVASDGTFTAHRLAPGTWSLLVQGGAVDAVEDYVRDAEGEVISTLVVAGQSVEVGEVVLVPEAVIEGRVVDSDGLPLGGVELTLMPGDAGLPELLAETDDHGRYELRGVVAGSYRLRAAKAGLCPSDPGHVDAWWPRGRVERQAHWLRPETGEHIAGVDIVLPDDGDHDGMDDDWEETWGLDPTRDDGGEDPDEDGYTNLEEYQLGTRPLEAGDERGLGGCGGRLSLAWVVVPLGLGRRR